MKRVILIDTREKQPWYFWNWKDVKTERATLKSGDYSLKGFSGSGIAIERKSLMDLFGSMTSGRNRFYRELQRLGGFGLAALIVEASEHVVLYGSGRTMMSPARMLRTIYAWCAAFKIQIHFCSSKSEAEAKAYRLMMAWADARDLKK